MRRKENGDAAQNPLNNEELDDIIRREAQEYSAGFPDAKIISEEAKEFGETGFNVSDVKAQLLSKIAEAYVRGGGKNDAFAQERQHFVHMVMLYRVNRVYCLGEENLEDTVAYYESREDSLGDEEKADYYTALSGIAMAEALDYPARKQTCLSKAGTLLHEIGKEAVAESLEEIFNIILVCEEQ